ncbi:hypothetical protein GF360_03190 [candidate division WWE3 bacterium]|nr:hypothetical protein [candidate division WWE3 bacterium]
MKFFKNKDRQEKAKGIVKKLILAFLLVHFLATFLGWRRKYKGKTAKDWAQEYNYAFSLYEEEVARRSTTGDDLLQLKECVEKNRETFRSIGLACLNKYDTQKCIELLMQKNNKLYETWQEINYACFGEYLDSL